MSQNTSESNVDKISVNIIEENGNLKAKYTNGKVTNLYTKEFCDDYLSECYAPLNANNYHGFYKVKDNISIIGNTSNPIAKGPIITTVNSHNEYQTIYTNVGKSNNCIIPPDSNVYIDVTCLPEYDIDTVDVLSDRLYIKNYQDGKFCLHANTINDNLIKNATNSFFGFLKNCLQLNFTSVGSLRKNMEDNGFKVY